MKPTFYFPHDHNARGDENIIRLLRIHNWAGYGLYWAIVEKLYEGEGSISADVETIAYDLRAEAKVVGQILGDFGLFYTKRGRLRSHSVDRRLSIREEKSENAKASANARWGNADAMRTHSEGNAINKRKGKKEKERKKERTDTSEAAKGLCEKLAGKMLVNNPKARIPETTEAWEKAADLMLTRDGRTVQEVENVLDFSQADGFWKCNILSMTKLREKFDQLYLKMEATKNGTQNGNGGGSHSARIVGAAAPTPGKYDHLG